MKKIILAICILCFSCMPQKNLSKMELVYSQLSEIIKQNQGILPPDDIQRLQTLDSIMKSEYILLKSDGLKNEFLMNAVIESLIPMAVDLITDGTK